ncbi:MAG: iron ABC transporter permease [Anaerolineaceae bacterium]|nr:iron ABC transporter permease [Anaerolineaceae bacterium]
MTQARWLGILIASTVLLFILSLALGSIAIPLEDIGRILMGQSPQTPSWGDIVIQIRLPKAVTAFFAGASLGVAGALMQTFFRNPLAGPFILGVSAGASLGVAMVVLITGTLGGALLAGSSLLGDLGMTASASLGATLSLLVVLFFARRIHSNVTLLLVGIMLASFTSSLVSILLHYSIPERIQAYIRWTFGSFGGVTLTQLYLFIPILSFGLLLAFLQSKSLNALLLGEDYATSLGVHITRARLAILIAAAILGGTVTAYCGPIAFLGLATPHLCRGLFQTSDHRILFFPLMLMGGSLALLTGLVASLPGTPFALPVNAVTALIGVPIVLRILLAKQRTVSMFQ